MKAVVMGLGEKNNMLTFLGSVGSYQGIRMGKFKCDCGNIVELSTRYIKNGHVKSCGCLRRNKTDEAMKFFKEGEKYGHLTFTGIFEKGEKGRIHGYFNCDCGAKGALIKLSNIRSGYRKTCGCLRMNKQALSTHDRQRLYNTWCGMKRRCCDSESKHYCNYGGRGIIICNNWLNSFDTFVDWALSNGWRDNLTIERIDVNGNYEPSNCTWITMKEQHRNRRNNVEYTHNGITKCLDDWLTEFNVPRATYYSRLKVGKTEFKDLFGKPYQK